MATASPNLELDLLFLLNQASYALAAEMNEALSPHGINTRDWCVLTKAVEGGHTQREIAELALIDKTTMVTTLDALEAAGLAVRRASPADRRVKLVDATPAGRRLVERATTAIDGVIASVLGEVPATERRALVNGLQRLVSGRLAWPSHVEPGHVPRRRAVRTPS
jgi:DNA-binding MarR family transcriptional regulator